MFGGGGDHVIIGRRKRCGLTILLPAIKIIDSFCPMLLDIDIKPDENPLLLLLHNDVLHLFPHIISLRSLLRHFLSNHPHEFLIPGIYSISVFVLYLYLYFIHNRDKIFLPPKNQFSPLWWKILPPFRIYALCQSSLIIFDSWTP